MFEINVSRFALDRADNRRFSALSYDLGLRKTLPQIAGRRIQPLNGYGAIAPKDDCESCGSAVSSRRLSYMTRYVMSVISVTFIG